MNDTIHPKLAKLIEDNYRAILSLQCGEKAMLKILKELSPHIPPEIGDVEKKYQSYKGELFQDIAGALEKNRPGFAA